MSGMADGSLRHPEGAFRIGEVVEYLSATHGRWIPAAIVGLHSDGRVSLDVKPRADATRVRRTGDVEDRDFREGDAVEHFSAELREWVPATVERILPDGSVSLIDAADAPAATTSNPLHRLRVRTSSPQRLVELVEDEDETTPLVRELVREEVARALSPSSPRARARSPSPPAPTREEVRAGLEGLTLRQLKARALDNGATADAVEGLDDADDPKAAAIDLVIMHTQPKALVADDATIWIEGHPQAEYNGLYRKNAMHQGSPVYKNENDPNDVKFCYRYASGGVYRWCLNNEHTPDEDVCTAYIMSTGSLPAGKNSWKCFFDSRWSGYALTVSALVRCLPFRAIHPVS